MRGRPSPFKPNNWYFVDMTIPTEPVADDVSQSTWTNAQSIWEIILKSNFCVLVVKGTEVAEYNIPIKRHFIKQGISLFVKSELPKAYQNKKKMAKMFPWPDYPKENWWKKLRDAFPDEKFHYYRMPNQTHKEYMVERTYLRHAFYKNLYKRYLTLNTINNFNP